MVVVISRFRVSNGMEAEVERAFRERPRAVENAPGFLWLEVCVDTANPAVFYLITRWTDLDAFERWHGSPDHRKSHELIPRGLKLDATWTQVVRLVRIDGTAGPFEISRLTAQILDTVADSHELGVDDGTAFFTLRKTRQTR